MRFNSKYIKTKKNYELKNKFFKSLSILYLVSKQVYK